MNASWPRGVGVRAVCAWVVLAIMFILLCAANLPVATAPQAPQPATLSATPGGVAGGVLDHKFDPREWPAFLINGAEAYTQRKWAESQLAEIGYKTYTRINAIWLETDDCVNSTGANCQEGLTVAHLHVWKRIAASEGPARGYLVLEEDVTFHEHFCTLFPRYMAQLPADFNVVYVGQLSRVVLDHDPASKPLTSLIQSDVAPFTTHAYLLSRAGAAFLANHFEFLLARSGSVHASAPLYINADTPKLHPWKMTALELKIDFFMIQAHKYYFSQSGSQTKTPSWFTFESTTRVPAEFGRGGAKWTKNGDIQLGAASAGSCAIGQPDYLPCEAKLPPAARCGPSSGRLPLMGTGLAFQNKCRQFPFSLFAWAGEPRRVTPPTCAVLRTQIKQSPESEPTPMDCLDEGAIALTNPATAEFFRERDGGAFQDELLFVVAGDATLPPQNWSAFRETVIMVPGSKWMDRSLPAAVISVLNLPCGQPVGRCNVDFWMRPGTTDTAVLGQVIGRDEYGFLLQLELPPPETVLDAGANCGVASILFSKFYPDAQIVSVEAAADNFAALSKNVDGHVHIHPILAALWGEHGELSVVKGARGGREWDNEVKVLPAPQDDKNKGGVSGVTIADLLSKYGLTRFDFVKIDIEGSEKQVFESSDMEWLTGVSYVAVELHEDMNAGATAAVFNAIAEHGTFCHTTSGEYNVWISNTTERMRGYCALRAARGLDCCGNPAQ